jgi:thioredoxin reductase/Pyruvate/2-oxoacid:ferredoxin oxidoreductase delta subunit/bacterioferritin-associated ferredoxin
MAALFVAPPAASPALLYLDRIPELQLLSALLMDEELLQKTLEQAAELFKQKNISVSCLGSEKELAQHQGQRVFTFNPVHAEKMPAHTTVTTINELAGVNAAVAEEAFSFQISPGKRKKLVAHYRESQKPLLCSTPEHCLQYALLLRPGTWQQSLQEKPALHFRHEMAKREKAGPQKTGTLRISSHPILPPRERREIDFTFNDRQLKAYEGEVVTSALYAAGITIFGHHEKDGAAQGIYCVNGQCSQCMVIADNRPVKGCMTPVLPQMKVYSLESPPNLNDDSPVQEVLPNPMEIEVDVLIVGGGPAGISAAIELGGVGVEVLIVDDKQELGGKLSLQTHNFFGSVADCYAGSRGIQIGKVMAADLLKLPTVKLWLNSTVIGVFSDGKFGVSGNGKYKLVKPKKVLFTTGAREKSLSFPGCDLPGVYGAGAFQTLVNRDLIRCAERLFIIGGGNVGLIGAYHALQAGIDVVGLVEALPRCGGYKVHEDKIKRLGVPIWTSHTALRIEGREKVERIVTAAIDDKFRPIPGTERMFAVDTVLIAVGLNPVNELLQKAKEYGIEAYAAGDAEEIAEASAAIFSGKISGRKIAQSMGIDIPIPSNWDAFGELLKHHAGAAEPFRPTDLNLPVYPLLRCMQEIPCNPCIEACPNQCITMPGSILSLPEFGAECSGCGNCVLACPGLAINLVINDYDAKKEKALLMMPYEFIDDIIPLGKAVTTTDMEGNVVGEGKVIAYKTKESQNCRRLLLLEVPYNDKMKVAGFRIREIDEGKAIAIAAREGEDPIVCRCERVRKSEIVREIRAGVRDMNQLKAKTRAGLGGCNGKTCSELILRLFREEGVPLAEITMPTHRPLVAEVHLGDFIAKGIEEKS